MIFSCFIFCHFISYITFLKYFIRTERAIFLYHLGSLFIALSYLLIGYYYAPMPFYDFLTKAGIVLGCQIIYSITFLEIWSLTEGGYSLSILLSLRNSSGLNANLVQNELENIGAQKQTNRINHLLSLKLVSKENLMLKPTILGKLVAYFACFVAYLSDAEMVE